MRGTFCSPPGAFARVDTGALWHALLRSVTMMMMRIRTNELLVERVDAKKNLGARPR
jgi:hypothetical protein